jgi:murein DD-endopeptidase MepM/ murein hydrolase activator NlpD
MSSKVVTYMAGAGLIAWILAHLKKAKARARVPQAKAAGGHPYPIPKNRGAPFAAGPVRPVWPIHSASTNKRWHQVPYRDVNGTKHGRQSRAFKASRSGRNHVGIDIFANAGDIVLAPESGTLVKEQNFLNSIPGKDAVIMQGDSGVVILFGEVVAKSYEEFGHQLGSRVERGEPIGRVGLTKKGSHMLHFETYRQGSTRNRRWNKGTDPHPDILDPTAYLLRARVETGQPFPYGSE